MAIYWTKLVLAHTGNTYYNYNIVYRMHDVQTRFVCFSNTNSESLVSEELNSTELPVIVEPPPHESVTDGGSAESSVAMTAILAALGVLCVASAVSISAGKVDLATNCSGQTLRAWRSQA